VYFVNLLQHNGEQIPSNRPIGLYLDSNDSGRIELAVEVADEPVDEAFKIVFRNWKQGYCIINPKKSADFLIKNLPAIQQRERFEVYCKGEFINLPEDHEMIAIRGFYQGSFVERSHNLQGTAIDLI
jgi:hypothetical protein